MNKIFLKTIGLIIFFVLLSGVLRWMKITLPPSFQYTSTFYLDKQTQRFDDISLSNGNYRLGFYIGKIDVIGEKNDGDYSLKYYCDNHIVRQVNNIHIKNNEEVYYDNSDWHTMIFIDKFNLPNDISCNNFSLEITAEKSFSLFKKLNVDNPTTLYIKKSEYASQFEQILSQEQKTFSAKYPNDFINVPIEPVEDSNATKQALLDALLKKDFDNFQKLLIANNLDANVELGEDGYGKQRKRTPLFYAANRDDLPIVSYLLQHGADIHHKDFIQKTALQYAIESNAVQTVAYLLGNGADVKDACYVYSIDNRNGVYRGEARLTPLVFAAKYEYFDLFQTLLEHGFRKIDMDCSGLDVNGQGSAVVNAWKKMEHIDSKKDSNNPSAQDTHQHIYHYLYDMQYPVRFLMLYKQYGLKDEKYEKLYTKEWFKRDYLECKTGLYGGRCMFINDENITLEEYDLFKFFELIGKINRKEKTNIEGNK